MTKLTRSEKSILNRQAHAAERATVAKPRGLDPLDEPVQTRVSLKPIPWNKTVLTIEERDAVSVALLGGYPRAEIAVALGVNVTTLRRLITDDKVLMDAVAARKDLEEAELCDLLTANARRGDSAAAMFLLKARHGYRDRDDANQKRDEGKKFGVMLMPAPMSFDDWSASTAAQQAQFREGDPTTSAFAPGAQELADRAQRHALRTRTILSDGMSMERCV
ncbi:hypothetical protein [Sphingorhabdus lacus]|uniref:Uncharacterized protein n=1 Tax=Sphingorhabdus lacus TaxID=392610 RepID=A0A6I6L420_9SPHN|nr:hypothetical protein [Sphingorhabdus lacus]QGY80810.1 hypothetical protein EUU25_09370 [Sphingorhabdus lacus]